MAQILPQRRNFRRSGANSDAMADGRCRFVSVLNAPHEDLRAVGEGRVLHLQPAGETPRAGLPRNAGKLIFLSFFFGGGGGEQVFLLLLLSLFPITPSRPPPCRPW
jgi:hypothetical protein